MLIPGTYGYVIFQGKGDLQCNERSCDGEMTLDYLGEVLSERSLSVEERCQDVGESGGQGSLVCCSPRGCAELGTTERVNNSSVTCHDRRQGMWETARSWKRQGDGFAPGASRRSTALLTRGF